MGKAVLASRVEDARFRFPEAIAEIRSLLSAAGIVTGDPAAIVEATDALRSHAGIQNSVAGLLQGVIAQTPGMSTLELLGVVLAAIAGDHASAAEMAIDPDNQMAMAQLFEWLLPLQKRYKEATGDHAAEQASSLQKGDLAVPANAVEKAEFDKEPQPDAVRSPSVRPANEAYARAIARALALSAEEQTFPADVRQLEPAARPSTMGAGSASLEPLPSSGEPLGHSTERRWLYGICGVLLGLLLGFAGAYWARSPRSLAPATIGGKDILPGEPSVVEGTRGNLPTASFPRAERHHEHESSVTPASSRPDRTKDGAVTGPRGEARGVGAPHASPGTPVNTARSAREPAAAARAGRSGVAPPVPRIVDLRDPLLGRPDRGTAVHLPAVTSGTSGIMAANLLSSPLPMYPVQARAAGVQGEVVVEAVVGRDGNVVETRVVSGPPLLRDAALGAVQQWQYRPYEVDGKATEITTMARLQFRLRDE